MAVRDLWLASETGMIIVYAGEIMTMLGLPKISVVGWADVDILGKIHGLF